METRGLLVGQERGLQDGKSAQAAPAITQPESGEARGLRSL